MEQFLLCLQTEESNFLLLIESAIYFFLHRSEYRTFLFDWSYNAFHFVVRGNYILKRWRLAELERVENWKELLHQTNDVAQEWFAYAQHSAFFEDRRKNFSECVVRR